MYSTENEEKSSVVERWNRTIKQRSGKSLKLKVIHSIYTYYLKYLNSMMTQKILASK